MSLFLGADGSAAAASRTALSDAAAVPAATAPQQQPLSEHTGPAPHATHTQPSVTGVAMEVEEETKDVTSLDQQTSGTGPVRATAHTSAEGGGQNQQINAARKEESGAQTTTVFQSFTSTFSSSAAAASHLFPSSPLPVSSLSTLTSPLTRRSGGSVMGAVPRRFPSDPIPTTGSAAATSSAPFLSPHTPLSTRSFSSGLTSPSTGAGAANLLSLSTLSSLASPLPRSMAGDKETASSAFAGTGGVGATIAAGRTTSPRSPTRRSPRATTAAATAASDSISFHARPSTQHLLSPVDSLSSLTSPSLVPRHDYLKSQQRMSIRGGTRRPLLLPPPASSPTHSAIAMAPTMPVPFTLGTEGNRGDREGHAAAAGAVGKRGGARLSFPPSPQQLVPTSPLPLDPNSIAPSVLKSTPGLIPIAPPASFVPPSPVPLTSPFKPILRRKNNSTPAPTHTAVAGQTTAEAAALTPHRETKAEGHAISADASFAPTPVKGDGVTMQLFASPEKQPEKQTEETAAAMPPVTDQTEAVSSSSTLSPSVDSPASASAASSAPAPLAPPSASTLSSSTPPTHQRRSSLRPNAIRACVAAAEAALQANKQQEQQEKSSTADTTMKKEETKEEEEAVQTPTRSRDRAATAPASAPPPSSLSTLSPPPPAASLPSSLSLSLPPSPSSSSASPSRPRRRVRFDRATIFEFSLVPDASKVPGGDGEYAVGLSRTPHAGYVASLETYEKMRAKQRKEEGPEFIDEDIRRRVWMQAQREAERMSHMQKRRSGINLQPRHSRSNSLEIILAGKKRKREEEEEEEEEEYWEDEEDFSDAALSGDSVSDADLEDASEDSAEDDLLDGAEMVVDEQLKQFVEMDPTSVHMQTETEQREEREGTEEEAAPAPSSLAALPLRPLLSLSSSSPARLSASPASSSSPAPSRPPSPSSACFRVVPSPRGVRRSLVGGVMAAHVRQSEEEGGAAAASLSSSSSSPSPSPSPPSLLFGPSLLFSDRADLSRIRASRDTAGCNCRGSRLLKVCGPVQHRQSQSEQADAEQASGDSPLRVAPPRAKKSSSAPAASAPLCPCYESGVGCNSNICRCYSYCCANPHDERYVFNQSQVNAKRRKILQEMKQGKGKWP